MLNIKDTTKEKDIGGTYDSPEVAGFNFYTSPAVLSYSYNSRTSEELQF